MTRWRMPVAAISALSLLLASATAGATPPTPMPAAAQPPAQAAEVAGPTGSEKITLITGDQVTYRFTADGTLVDADVTAARREDGRPVVFTQVRERDQYYVFPSDATELVRTGRLDRRLFDVSYLTKYGYTDTRSSTLPLILRYGATTAKAATSADALPATSNVHALTSIRAAAVSVGKTQTGSFWAAVDTPSARILAGGVVSVWLDGKVQASLDVSVPQIGAPEAWQAGYTGKGVKVAVLDTGIDDTHPDLAGKIAASQSFITGQTVTDGHGHGTHVADTIVGSGAASGGKYNGVAPDATLLVGKVLDNTGTGPESNIIAGMQWAAAQGADVISMSLGGCCTDGTDPMSQAVNDLSAQYQTLFVVAAGNETIQMTVGSPGVADAALTVAAVDKQDQRASFSSQGPRVGDYGLKPDIAAPGVSIVAARAAGTSLGTPVGDKYASLSGTSMATPHVAGAAVLLAQQHPDWTGQQLKSALISSAKEIGSSAYEVGSGRVDVARAVGQGVYSSGNVDFGILPPPYDAPATKTITYVNTTQQPVTLNLTASIKANEGTAPADALKVPETITVPAEGSAPVAVTFDPSGPGTWYQGSIVATADDLRLHNAVAAYVEPKRHAFTANIALPAGATDVRYNTWYFQRLDDQKDLDLWDNQLFASAAPSVDGSLDEGTYSVQTSINWRDAHGNPQITLLIDPQVNVRADTNVALDARTATKVSTRTPRASAAAEAQYGYAQTSASGLRGLRVSASSPYRQEWGLWATPTEQVTVGQFLWRDDRLLTTPLVAMTVGGMALDPKYFSLHVQDARFNGLRRLPLVFGEPVPGAVVLLDVSDLCPAMAWSCRTGVLARVTEAQKAGAVGILVYGAIGRAIPVDDAQDDIAVPIPALTLPAEQGQALRDRLAGGPVTLTVVGTATIPYVYSLSYPVEGRIPRLQQSASARDLYQFDSRYHADAPGELDLNWGASMKTNRLLGSTKLTMRAPGTLTEYVGPMQNGVLRTRGATLMYDGPPDMEAFHRNGWLQSRADVLTRTGRRTDTFGAQPLVHAAPRTVTPEMNDYYWRLCQACRSGSVFMPWHIMDSDGLGGGAQSYHSTQVLRGEPQTQLRMWGPDGQEILVQEGFWLFFIAFIFVPYFVLPDEPGRYRLRETYPAPYKPQRWARTVESEWTFTTAKPTTGFPYRPPKGYGVHCGTWDTFTSLGSPDKGSCEANSQLYLGYDLDLRLDNTLPAGRDHKITVNGYHHSYRSTDPELTSLKLSVSYDDGTTWQPVRTTKSGRSEYTATLKHPRLQNTTGAVSLRTEAVGTAGNTVTQTITRAYGLTAR
ncbi:subtilisin family serine protease [Kribbella sp. VKM Ac-2527]|uniref:Subtilisin family serine protease n=1 Tax=Kribbella caucasensis TaxID=2512215 RepID=A0A4R6JJ17_9ACTN|nr:S8 family serine peptidase [Kribbella sp. VKM Ac-2527]TDO35617.1 subtilisin family serine protease [Kribbella sp. VKM Ac-2527]